MTKKQIISEVKAEILRRKEDYPKRIRMYLMDKQVAATKIEAMEKVLKIVEGTPEQLVLDLPEYKPVVSENQIKMKL